MMSENGKLIKRPLMVDENTVTCGFKPEVYQKLGFSCLKYIKAKNHVKILIFSLLYYRCLANFLASPTRWMKSFNEFSWSW